MVVVGILSVNPVCYSLQFGCYKRRGCTLHNEALQLRRYRWIPQLTSLFLRSVPFFASRRNPICKQLVWPLRIPVSTEH